MYIGCLFGCFFLFIGHIARYASSSQEKHLKNLSQIPMKNSNTVSKHLERKFSRTKYQHVCQRDAIFTSFPNDYKHLSVRQSFLKKMLENCLFAHSLRAKFAVAKRKGRPSRMAVLQARHLSFFSSSPRKNIKATHADRHLFLI